MPNINLSLTLNWDPLRKIKGYGSSVNSLQYAYFYEPEKAISFRNFNFIFFLISVKFALTATMKFCPYLRDYLCKSVMEIYFLSLVSMIIIFRYFDVKINIFNFEIRFVCFYKRFFLFSTILCPSPYCIHL